MKKLFKILCIILGIILFYFILKLPVFKNILYVIVLSFILAYSLRPLHKFLLNKGLNRKFSAALLVILLISLFIFSFLIVIPNILKEGLSINTQIDEMERFLSNIYNNIKVNNNRIFYLLEDILGEKLNRWISNFSSEAVDSLIALGENFIALAVIPVVAYYFLVDEEKINNKILLIFPVGKRAMVRNISRDIDNILGRYILSQFLLSVIISLLTFIVLFTFKVNFPILLSILNGLFNIIPYFGPIFGSIPAIFIALMHSTKKAIWVAVFLSLIQQLEGDIISPKIIGDNISMHPMVIILLLLIGGKLGGFLGMVLAIPVGVIIKVLYEDINYYLF